MSDKFVTGLFVNPPHEKAPDFVKMSLSIKPAEFAEWLKAQEPSDKGYIRIQVKEGKSGKWYAELDTWKPKGGEPSDKPAKPERPAFVDDSLDDLPF